MIGPPWLADALAATVLTVALFSAGRLIISRGRPHGEVDADGAHILMGVAMAGMFVPGLVILPAAVWGVTFTAGAAWFGWRSAGARRGRLAGLSVRCCEYPVPHLIDCLAMLYALWAVRAIRTGGLGAAGMTAMAGGAGGARLPALGLVLALSICGYVVWLGDRIQRLAPASAAVRGSAGSGRGSAGSGRESAGSGRLPGLALPAPRAATCCKIAMGVAMGVMLADMF